MHGTLIDDLALHRALGLPHDDRALAIDPSVVVVSSAADAHLQAESTKAFSVRNPPAGREWDAWVAFYRGEHPVLPSVDRVIWPAAQAAFPKNKVTKQSVRNKFGGLKRGPRTGS